MLHYLQGLLSALDLTSLLDAVLRVAAIFLCVARLWLTVHETCHGLAALALGDPTAKSMHRLSLNPLRHIDWIGLLMMFVAGFGWAKPVPVDPRYFRKPKQGMALTALAGPVSNFVLAFLAAIRARIMEKKPKEEQKPVHCMEGGCASCSNKGCSGKFYDNTEVKK